MIRDTPRPAKDAVGVSVGGGCGSRRKEKEMIIAIKITKTQEEKIKDIDVAKLKELDAIIKKLDGATVDYPQDVLELLRK